MQLGWNGIFQRITRFQTSGFRVEDWEKRKTVMERGKVCKCVYAFACIVYLCAGNSYWLILPNDTTGIL